MITQQQRRVMLFIQDYMDQHGVSPSYDEIGAAIGTPRRSSVHRLITCLIERGYLHRKPHFMRSVAIVQRIQPIYEMHVFDDEAKEFRPLRERASPKSMNGPD